MGERGQDVIPAEAPGQGRDGDRLQVGEGFLIGPEITVEQLVLAARRETPGGDPFRLKDETVDDIDLVVGG